MPVTLSTEPFRRARAVGRIPDKAQKRRSLLQRSQADRVHKTPKLLSISRRHHAPSLLQKRAAGKRRGNFGRRWWANIEGLLTHSGRRCTHRSGLAKTEAHGPAWMPRISMLYQRKIFEQINLYRDLCLLDRREPSDHLCRVGPNKGFLLSARPVLAGKRISNGRKIRNRFTIVEDASASPAQFQIGRAQEGV